MAGLIDERCPGCDAPLEVDVAVPDGATLRCAACSSLFDLAPAPEGIEAIIRAAA